MCRVLEIERTGFYAWLAEPFSQRALADIIGMIYVGVQSWQRGITDADQNGLRGGFSGPAYMPSMAITGSCFFILFADVLDPLDLSGSPPGV